MDRVRIHEYIENNKTEYYKNALEKQRVELSVIDEKKKKIEKNEKNEKLSLTIDFAEGIVEMGGKNKNDKKNGKPSQSL